MHRGTLWCDNSMFKQECSNTDYKNIHILSNYTLKLNALYVTSTMLF